ncbi:hypothetical protein [Paenibacillus silagei]|uniref:Uncharacterized protein with PQ loop repeat n=1 Tax=Paenibacillus silagei TaxID=1670801 RepID=A0ABS4NSW9_9BACL|nr:hypothetical protein [Paenibacillus silagei]MBP2112525.1 uncharacterized protein with PQ loop repeat [Paenibacillus silagei]
MLKLLKYDLKRRKERILVFIVIALLAQAGLWISSAKIDAGVASLNLAVYCILAIAMIFIVVTGYFRNLKSYQRRLLPVTALQTVLSPMLLALLLIGVVVLLGLAHLGIYKLLYTVDFLPGNLLTVGFRALLQSVWSILFLMVMVMFSFTVAFSLRMKGRVWLGIALLVLLENGIGYLEKFLFDTYFIGLDNAFNFEIYPGRFQSGSDFTIKYLPGNQGALLFEVAVVCLMIYGMVALVKRRIEV